MSLLLIPTLKPRNPLVAAARARRAGKHQASRGAERQRGQSQLRQELRQPPPPSP